MDFGNADSWGAAIYFWIFPFVIGDAIFPPVPSEMLVITGGALSAEGHINAFLVVLLAAVSSWLGDLLVFELFKRRLSHVLDRWKWGQRFHAAVHSAIAKAGRSYTYGAIIGLRFIPGGRLATTAAAEGVMGIRWFRRRAPGALAVGVAVLTNLGKDNANLQPLYIAPFERIPGNDRFVHTPSHYGWTWDARIQSNAGPFTPQQVSRIRSDGDIRAVTAGTYGVLTLRGHEVATYGTFRELWKALAGSV